MPIARVPFEVGGRALAAFRLANAAGAELRVAALGGAILSLRVPDRDGRVDDVVLGYAEPASYVSNPSYLGVIVGRYANRIAGARFAIDGTEYRVTANDGPNHLHGGARGFSHAEWQIEPFEEPGRVGLMLEHASPDATEGFPGTVHARATYTLTEQNELIVAWYATTDRPTHVALTQHSYFNLGGHGAGDVRDHVLTVAADRFLPVGSGLIPTGELRDVTGTPFDFREPRALGERIDAPDEQLRIARGYDHCFVLAPAVDPGSGEPAGADELRFAARVIEPVRGRTLEVWTTEPGLQLYTGNYLGDGLRGKEGATYGARDGFALETQHFPDSPNRPSFPSTLLRPGQVYASRTVYAFGVA